MNQKTESLSQSQYALGHSDHPISFQDLPGGHSRKAGQHQLSAHSQQYISKLILKSLLDNHPASEAAAAPDLTSSLSTQTMLSELRDMLQAMHRAQAEPGPARPSIVTVAKSSSDDFDYTPRHQMARILLATLDMLRALGGDLVLVACRPRCAAGGGWRAARH
jgi:hypothetical protein